MSLEAHTLGPLEGPFIQPALDTLQPQFCICIPASSSSDSFGFDIANNPSVEADRRTSVEPEWEKCTAVTSSECVSTCLLRGAIGLRGSLEEQVKVVFELNICGMHIVLNKSREPV